jgi:hypothetical protein
MVNIWEIWEGKMGKEDCETATLYILENLIIAAMRDGQCDDELAYYLMCSVESLRLEAKERYEFIREK